MSTAAAAAEMGHMTSADGPDRNVAAQDFSPTPTATTGTSGTAQAGSKNLALAAILCAVAMTFIDQTIVAIASPRIQSELSLTRPSDEEAA